MNATPPFVAIFLACTLSIFAADQPELKLKPALDAITPDGLLSHIKVLASDEFEGRAPGSKGAVISLGRAYSKLNPPPKRSLLFMSTTAEEAGLLGAKYYAQHPLYPLEKTLADINIDGVNPWGKSHDLEDLTNGNSTLDDLLGHAAGRQGRAMK